MDNKWPSDFCKKGSFWTSESLLCQLVEKSLLSQKVAVEHRSVFRMCLYVLDNAFIRVTSEFLCQFSQGTGKASVLIFLPAHTPNESEKVVKAPVSLFP